MPSPIVRRMVQVLLAFLILECRIRRLAHAIAAVIVARLLLLGIVPAWAADWRQEIGTFRIGMVVSGTPTATGLEALRRSYSTALGMPVDFFIARDFAMLIDAQATSRVEYAIYSATAYATAAELCDCVEPVAAPTDIDGASGIRSFLISRNDKVASLGDVPKARLVVPPPDDVSGWLAPLSLLSKEGLTLRGDEPFVKVTSTVVEAETVFVNAEADALLGWERVLPSGEALAQGGTIDRLRRAGADVPRLHRIWTSSIIPYGPHVVLKSLDPEAKAVLSAYLVGLHAGDPQAYDLLSGGHAGGFVTIDESAYAPVRDIVKTLVVSEP